MKFRYIETDFSTQAQPLQADREELMLNFITKIHTTMFGSFIIFWSSKQSSSSSAGISIASIAYSSEKKLSRNEIWDNAKYPYPGEDVIYDN